MASPFDFLHNAAHAHRAGSGSIPASPVSFRPPILAQPRVYADLSTLASFRIPKVVKSDASTPVDAPPLPAIISQAPITTGTAQLKPTLKKRIIKGLPGRSGSKSGSSTSASASPEVELVPPPVVVKDELQVQLDDTPLDSLFTPPPESLQYDESHLGSPFDIGAAPPLLTTDLSAAMTAALLDPTSYIDVKPVLPVQSIAVGTKFGDRGALRDAVEAYASQMGFEVSNRGRFAVAISKVTLGCTGRPHKQCAWVVRAICAHGKKWVVDTITHEHHPKCRFLGDPTLVSDEIEETKGAKATKRSASAGSDKLKPTRWYYYESEDEDGGEDAKLKAGPWAPDNVQRYPRRKRQLALDDGEDDQGYSPPLPPRSQSIAPYPKRVRSNESSALPSPWLVADFTAEPDREAPVEAIDSSAMEAFLAGHLTSATAQLPTFAFYLCQLGLTPEAIQALSGTELQAILSSISPPVRLKALTILAKTRLPLGLQLLPVGPAMSKAAAEHYLSLGRHDFGEFLASLCPVILGQPHVAKVLKRHAIDVELLVDLARPELEAVVDDAIAEALSPVEKVVLKSRVLLWQTGLRKTELPDGGSVALS